MARSVAPNAVAFAPAVLSHSAGAMTSRPSGTATSSVRT